MEPEEFHKKGEEAEEFVGKMKEVKQNWKKKFNSQWKKRDQQWVDTKAANDLKAIEDKKIMVRENCEKNRDKLHEWKEEMLQRSCFNEQDQKVYKDKY